MFDKLIENGVPVTFPVRFNKPWKSPSNDEHGNPIFTPTHIICSLHPDPDAHGDVKTVMSCLTDVSELKWIEAQLRTRMDQAIQIKQQQEKFIDMTSHEMRNPLSAMLSCADMILSSLSPYSTPGISKKSDPLDTRYPQAGTPSQNWPLPLPSHLVDDAIEAADTIIYCAMHQKRIVDDILTLSRIDSDFLVITPEKTQVVQLVSNALKMFEAELKRADVALKFVEEQSIKDLNIQWTLLDPSRVIQIFINLVTNSIKFTRKETIRQITVSLGASVSRPSENSDGIKYIPKSTNCRDHTLSAEWGDGEVIYLSILVSDTGCGLSEEEQLVLFKLFQQASPKTHVRYGGSGLGLFISRQMVEMQGGEIGVKSDAGKGSTFKFFVKSRRTEAPAKGTLDVEFPALAYDEGLYQACELPSSASTEKTSNFISPPTSPLTDLHILVVEDNIVNQKVVSKQLRNSGCTVHVANHGEEALDFLRRSEYWETGGSGQRLSVVLMDLEMPVMDGITCVKKIREFQLSGKIKGHVPVIAVTANARRDQIDAAKEAGMDDVATKPYRMDQIFAQINELVERYRKPDQLCNHTPLRPTHRQGTKRKHR